MYLSRIAKYKDGQKINMDYMHWTHWLPELGKALFISNDKLGRDGYLRTSRVRWLGVAQSKKRVRYFAKTYNSMYVITISKEEIEFQEQF